MATMNPANVGGPVGGGMMMMNNGSPAVQASGNSSDGLRPTLNTWVFDYLLKHRHYDIARSVVNDKSYEMRTENKSSPGRRKDGDMNGDGDIMDMNIKDDVPDDLPRPQGWDGDQSSGFLLEWFSIFYDLLQAHRVQAGGKINGANMATNPAATYLFHERQMQRMRESAQNQNINRPGMNPAMLRQMQQNGAMNGNMNKPMTQQQMQQMQQMQQIQNRKAQVAMQMQRGEQPDAEMNGARPGTPAEGDNGGSPSKRLRLDNGQQQFNNGMMQNGRPGGVPGAGNQGMMIQAGFNPAMNPQFRGNGAMPPKSMQAAMSNGMMNMGSAGSPMMQGMNQFTPDNMPMDMYQRNMQAVQPGMQGGGGGQSGNHALQDYQMQLMLLEQQNKKRLMMARQEQHDNNPGNGGPMPGVGMQATGMSPNGSRTGTSPNPGEMKRTPGMGGGLPGSPSAAEAIAGRSPVGMGFMGNMQNPDFNAGMFMGGKDPPMMGAGPGMRPPTSADMNPMRQQAGRVNNQFPGAQPMAQQASQGGQQGMGTPGQRNEMPPPQAPAGAGGAQRTAGGSPNGSAPITPSQQNKPNPKAKKGAAKEDNKRQRPTKKNSSANTGAGDENPPATPTPSTPITPNNPGAINAGNKGQPGMQQNNPHQQQNQGMQMDQPDLGQSNAFSDFNNAQDPQFNLDFSTLENADVLENFDFDTFLNTSATDMLDFNGDIGVGGDFGMNQPE